MTEWKESWWMEPLSSPRPYYFFHYPGLPYEPAAPRKLLKLAAEMADTIYETLVIFHWLSELLQLISTITSLSWFSLASLFDSE